MPDPTSEDDPLLARIDLGHPALPSIAIEVLARLIAEYRGFKVDERRRERYTAAHMILLVYHVYTRDYVPELTQPMTKPLDLEL